MATIERGAKQGVGQFLCITSFMYCTVIVYFDDKENV